MFAKPSQRESGFGFPPRHDDRKGAMILDYDAPATWPAEVINFLDGTLAILDDWHGDQRFATPYEYDDIIRRLYAVLEPHDILA